MIIKFLKDFTYKKILFQKDEIITADENMRMEKLNDKQRYFVFQGKCITSK